MGSIITAISNIAGAAMAFCGWGKQRDAEKNSSEMKAAASAAGRVATGDQIDDDLASGNLEKVRKDEASS